MFDALDRLHERLREAEESRDVVVGQVRELKRQCQVNARFDQFPPLLSLKILIVLGDFSSISVTALSI